MFRLIAAPAVGLVFVFLPSPYADWIALGLFITAASTDYLDGYLARKWNQITNLGRMLDPIADKAMVLIALLVIAVRSPYAGLDLLTPIILITFREVFVSGLREFLGDKAGTLKVTGLAKWKTASQMVAIMVILASFLFGHYYWALSSGMSDEIVIGIMEGEIEDIYGLRWIIMGADWSSTIGAWLLWIAAGLTMITGLDYFRKALPILKEI
ncbi:MAG TPA: CDP-diacylglycerol--glycerol-3-phosphate 3-phosphatidyltransferase [Rhodobacteraceae bacterium]|nr:CDP-diacylglycerol--glycerol-3-phosphate 3-phosphatidyltransferase [Paracoccaceae bacterium]